MTTRRPAAAPARRSRKSAATTKLFVLDTNVLMHDPTSLFRFEEHDIFVPIMTLEELDNNKKGMTEVARNARQVSRLLDEIVSGAEESIARGICCCRPKQSTVCCRSACRSARLTTRSSRW